MSSSKPDIVIVCGGWHLPAAYDKLRTLLESQDLTVHIPHLPTMNGARPPNADLYTDVETIDNLVTKLADAGRSVVVLLHSYGGQVGTNGLAGLGFEARRQHGLPGGVTRLVYIAGGANKENQSMMDLVEEFGNMDLVPLAFDIAEDGTSISRDPKMLIVGPGLSDADLENYVGGLVRFNANAMYQPLTHCSWREIPTTYVFTTTDLTIPLSYQKHMVAGMEAAGRQVQTFTLETGHCPNITQPEELAKIIEQILA
ncbi:hypothetical protein N7507_006347 [Penicillium longicatenatum]|nr:hypothetical protein N7507_006347 [Penicillium longicatenatum]